MPMPSDVDAPSFAPFRPSRSTKRTNRGSSIRNCTISLLPGRPARMLTCNQLRLADCFQYFVLGHPDLRGPYPFARNDPPEAIGIWLRHRNLRRRQTWAAAARTRLTTIANRLMPTLPVGTPFNSCWRRHDHVRRQAGGLIPQRDAPGVVARHSHPLHRGLEGLRSSSRYAVPLQAMGSVRLPDRSSPTAMSWIVALVAGAGLERRGVPDGELGRGAAGSCPPSRTARGPRPSDLFPLPGGGNARSRRRGSVRLPSECDIRADTRS